MLSFRGRWIFRVAPHFAPSRNICGPTCVPVGMVTEHRSDAPTAGHVLHWAHVYDLFGNIVTLGRAGAMREQTVELAALSPGERVLEVGCGTGEVAQRARSRVGATGQVSGIDPSAEMIAVAQRKARRAGLDIDYRVGAIEALPYPDASFDVVLSSLMMHHLPDDLKSGGLAEVRRVLKPGGRLLIVDFKGPRRWFSRLAMRLVLHGHLGGGFEQLPAIVAAAELTDVRNGATRFDFLGFVAAKRPA
jgi:ubiquinone/menaquinone biosynthesis C-methylase UbiE